MKKITNNILKKEIKKIYNYLYIFLIFLALGLLLIAIGIYDNKQKESSYTYLNDIIVNKNNEENSYAYLEIAQQPYSIAKYENDEENAFYIVFDGRYYYIAYLSNDLYNNLNVEGLEDNPLTIYGTTTKTPEELRQIAIEVYNEGLDEENQISLENFNSYFGEVYLNNTSLKKINSAFYILSIIPFTIALIFLGIFITKKIKVRNVINHLTEEEMNKLEKEIEQKDSIHYEKLHLILTKNYIVSFEHGFTILAYKDIIWIYEHKLKQYGITTANNIFVTDQKGKNYNIVSTDGLNKKTNAEMKEIILAISSKNEKMLVGYSKKNQEEINLSFGFL